MYIQLKKLIFVFLVSFFTITANAGDKWAVIIGINDYKIIRPDLRYCESDALKMKDFLVKKAKFDEKRIKILLGDKATKKNIRDAITNWLASNVKQDDRMVLYFSGHGVQFQDDNGDEEDGLDEMICAYDSGRIDFTFVKDDELSRWLRTISTNDKIVILDCCHSGTGTKAVSINNNEDMPTIKAYYPEPDMSIQRATEEDIKGYLGDERAAEVEIQMMKQSQDEYIDGVASISGCRDDQVSMESPRLEGGVLTYYLTKTLNKLTENSKVVTVYEAWKNAKNEIRKKNWQQEPQFNGNQNISIIDEEEITIDPFDGNITLVLESVLKISIGTDKDVTRGSIYSVYPKDSLKIMDKPKAKIKIIRVMKDYSEAILLKDYSDTNISVGDKVIEESHYIETESLLVHVEPFKFDSDSEKIAQNATEQVLNAIKEIENVRVTQERQTPDLIIQGKVEKTDNGKFKIGARLVEVNIASSNRPISVVIREPSEVGSAIFEKLFADPKNEFGEPIRDEYNNVIPGFAKQLRRCYVMKSLAKLENPNSGFKINLSIDKGSQAVYKPGDVVSISMQPTRSCYVYLLDIGTSGAISLLFPNRWHRDNYIKAGQKFSINSYDENGDYQIEVYPPPGEERIKAIATTQPISFEQINPDDIDSPIKTFTDNALNIVEFAMKDLRIKPRNKWAVEDVFFRIGDYNVYQEGSREPIELEMLE